MTQQKLGAMVGVSYRTIRAWEVEGRYPKPVSYTHLDVYKRQLKIECVTIDSEVRIMRVKEELPECPVATAVSLIGGKWKLLILRNLKERPWRFNELQQMCIRDR